MNGVSFSKINRAVKRLEKRGYTVNLPNLYKGQTKLGLPRKKYTQKELEKIRNFRTRELYEYSNINIGGIEYTGVEGRKIERSLSAQKRAITRKRNKQREQDYWEDLIGGYDGYEEIANDDLSADTIILDFLSPSKWSGYIQDSARHKKILEDAKFLVDLSVSIYGKKEFAQAIYDSPDEVIKAVQRSYIDSLYMNFEQIYKYLPQNGMINDKLSEIRDVLNVDVYNYIPNYSALMESEEFTRYFR